MDLYALPGYYVPAPALAKLQEARDKAAPLGNYRPRGHQALLEAVDDLLEAASRADQLAPVLRRLIAAGEVGDG